MKKNLMFTLITLATLSGNAIAGNAYLELREDHWLEAMQIGRVDSEILYAISLQESGTTFKGMREFGPWPWAMNINEEPKFYSSREAARKVLAEEVSAGNKNIAVGMWQIHLRYNSHYVEDPLDLVDPVTNLYVAAMVLRGCGEIYDKVEEVLSCYHSGDVDEAGVAYADRVLALAEKWGKPFRLSKPQEGIRFTHDRRENAGNRMMVQIERGEEVQAQSARVQNTERVPTVVEEAVEEKTISLAMLGTATKRTAEATHADFLQRVGRERESGARRVIVVD
jgi:hypothetical protein